MFSSEIEEKLPKKVKKLEWTKRVHATELKQIHKLERVEFARAFINNYESWCKTIFKDEKKFNLDNPDYYQYYWHDLKKKKEWYKTCQHDGGSSMIWEGMSVSGKIELVFFRRQARCSSILLHN
jgi:hypothetical protein